MKLFRDNLYLITLEALRCDAVGISVQVTSFPDERSVCDFELAFHWMIHSDENSALGVMASKKAFPKNFTLHITFCLLCLFDKKPNYVAEILN